MAKLLFRWGSMGAGKSLAIISVAHNFSRIGQVTKVFTTALDSRFGEGIVASRIGVSIPAQTFASDTEQGGKTT
jgi:thymidine kinase